MRIHRSFAVAPIAASLVLAAVGRPAAADLPPADQDIVAGRLELTLAKGGKMQIRVDGNVPFITDSHLYLVKPGWSGVLLNTDNMTPVLKRFTDGDAQILTADFDDVTAYAHYRFALLPTNTLVMRLAYGTKSSAPGEAPPPAEVEYAAGLLNANLLAGQMFTADTAGGSAHGIVPVSARTDDEEASRLTPALLRNLGVDSPLGRVTISVQGSGAATSALNLFDARKQSAPWATAHPAFWLGIGAPPLPAAAGENTVTVTYSLGPKPPHAPGGATKIVLSALYEVKEARTAVMPDLPLIPKPKEMVVGSTPLRLTRETRIVLPVRPAAEETAGASEIQDDLKSFWGLDVEIATGGKAKPGDIVFAAPNSEGRVTAGAPKRPEGYSLTISAAGASIAAHDPRGAYDAAQTFKQLIRSDPRGVSVKPVSIRDWPTLAFRGVQWYGGPDSLAFHKPMIDRILGPLKYNSMVLQAEYTAWDSQPNLRGDRTTPKSETRKTIAAARAHFLEPIPLVPSLGHMEWFFQNRQNLDLAADPAHPYTIDPENPRAYDALYPLYDEIIDLFHPRIFHIGHDEVTMTGTFPRKGSRATTTALYLQSVNQLHDWLAQRGIKTMIWGDMLLAPSEGTAGNAASRPDAAARRAGVPKDVIVGDWHYSGTTFPSIGLLEKSGFETVASTWYNPEADRLFAKEAAKQNAAGLLQTTWAGYTMTPTSVKSEDLPQFVAYLIGAEQAWNGGANAPDALGYDPTDAFLALYDRKPFMAATRPGFEINLASNSAIPTAAWSAFPPATVTSAGVHFDASHPIRMDGALNAGESSASTVTIPMNGRKVSSLAWLWGTTFATSVGVPVARVVVTYMDGQEEACPIVYGSQIAAFTDSRSTRNATRVLSGSGTTANTARSFEWTNPRPDVSIDHVTLASTGTEAAPVLLGVTGVY